jgi:hypothetical protein
MRRWSQSLVIALTTAMTGKAMAAGATVEVVKVKDQALLASFDHFEAVCSAGIDSAIDVQWNSSLIRADGTFTQSTVVVGIRYVNSCTGDDLLYSGFAQLTPNGNVTADQAHGHVDAVVPVMTDPDPDTGAFLTGTVNLNLDFTATGPANTIRDRFHSKDGGVVTMNNFIVSHRPGVAVGTAHSTLQGTNNNTYNVDLIGGQPSLSADLERDASGSMTIVTKAH